LLRQTGMRAKKQGAPKGAPYFLGQLNILSPRPAKRVGLEGSVGLTYALISLLGSCPKNCLLA